MLRPETFARSYVVFRNLPYAMADSAKEFSSMGGVLSRGQVVWLQGPDGKQSTDVTAFVDQVGLVWLDPRGLVPADILRE